MLLGGFSKGQKVDGISHSQLKGNWSRQSGKTTTEGLVCNKFEATEKLV